MKGNAFVRSRSSAGPVRHKSRGLLMSPRTFRIASDFRKAGI